MKRDIAVDSVGELPHCHLHIDGGRVDATMAQKVRDLVDRAPLSDKLRGQAMPHQMRAGGARKCDAALSIVPQRWCAHGEA